MNSRLLPLFISYRSSGEKLIKYQPNLSCVIMPVILMQLCFTKHWYYKEKFDAASLLGLKGLNPVCIAAGSVLCLHLFMYLFWLKMMDRFEDSLFSLGETLGHRLSQIKQWLEYLETVVSWMIIITFIYPSFKNIYNGFTIL